MSGQAPRMMLPLLVSMVIIKSTSQALKAERDEITAMKDNLNVGLFLMNKDLIIQDAYSRALEEILGSELQGKNFLDIISNSLNTREQQIMKGYFSMIINRTHEQTMLEEINPISEFTYLQSETGKEKNLTCSFVPVEREQGEVFILGTIHDVSAEVMLQQQITEEVNKRQEEMSSIFEIIQLDPKVFNDFIEDTTDEFNRINDLLKDNKLPNQPAIIQIYQSVHAVKSNSLILGLEDFSRKLHSLEGELNKLKEQEEISFEAVLHITLELEKIMKEKDKFQATIEKIASFGGTERHGENRKQSEYVLIETLIKTSEKASAALHKKVRFIVDEIDPDAIENGPRRAIKEVLMQLVRNAVYHGIETPGKRLAAGKEETGSINLSIKTENGKIHITLADDGQGLDFDRIRSKIVSTQLVDDKDNIDHKHLMNILFSPGFSTLDKADLHAGRGMGLSLVRDRIRGVRGAIQLNTNPGKGTSFKILIPV
jgi:two-component system chemotaxis sensor kinase CheA